MTSPNQNPEQIARDSIDAQLRAAGWVIQGNKEINFAEGEGQAVREYQTDTGPADYVLFVDSKPVGIIEAKKETLGHAITSVEEQTEGYSVAKLKWIQKSGQPLPFLYEATGVLTRFTDQRDPKPRSRQVFSFHRPETLRERIAQGSSLRSRLHDIPVLNIDSLRDCQIGANTPTGNSDQRYRITSIGAYAIDRLIQDFSYVDAVIVDTPIVDENLRNSIEDTDQSSLHKRLERADRFVLYLDEQWEHLSDNANKVFDWKIRSQSINSQICDMKKHS